MASLSTLDDDLVVSVASYGTPEDLLNLALTCRRLGSKMGAATQREWRALARDAKRQKTSLRLPCREWSLANEAARRVMDKSITVEERVCLPLRDGESWMGRYHELIMLRRPLAFDQLGARGGVYFPSEDESEVRIEKGDYDVGYLGYCTVMSSHIMRAGKHYASFSGSDHVRVGVFRPTTNAQLKSEGHYSTLLRSINERWGGRDVNYCAVDFTEGCCCWSGQGRGGVYFPSEDESEVRIEKGDYDVGYLGYCTVMSSHIMRAGKHYASFSGSDHVRVGVFRPTTNAQLKSEGHYSTLLRSINERWGGRDVNYCAVDFTEGCCCWSGQGVRSHLRWDHCSWLGQEAFEENDTAGLLLDLDEGTLTVYKNGRKLGIMKSGHTGEYCWGASLSDIEDQYVKISRGAIPE